MTLANIIVKDNDIYLLDSLLDKEASSYLLDFAKLKMSLDGYEERFCNGPHINKKYVKYLSKKLIKPIGTRLDETGSLFFSSFFVYRKIT